MSNFYSHALDICSLNTYEENDQNVREENFQNAIFWNVFENLTCKKVRYVRTKMHIFEILYSFIRKKYTLNFFRIFILRKNTQFVKLTFLLSKW